MRRRIQGMYPSGSEIGETIPGSPVVGGAEDRRGAIVEIPASDRHVDSVRVRRIDADRFDGSVLAAHRVRRVVGRHDVLRVVAPCELSVFLVGSGHTMRHVRPVSALRHSAALPA